MQNEEAGADTVSSLSERDLITRIQSRLPPPPPWMIVGIGDDAAVVEPERNRLEVLTVDAVVEGVHFDRAFTPPDAIGHRALAVNLSDLAAMGATPRLALVSLALPAAFDVDDFDGVVSGLVACVLAGARFAPGELYPPVSLSRAARANRDACGAKPCGGRMHRLERRARGRGPPDCPGQRRRCNRRCRRAADRAGRT